MLLKKDFDEIIRENFDLSDRQTRQYIISLEEDAERDKLLDALSAALYDNIVAKVDDIDFGTIPMSRGDITKVEKFDMTEQSLDLIRKLTIEYKQNPKIVDVIITAIQNVKDNKSLFVKGYALNVEFPMLIYNLITLSIIRATSMIIATCVQYVSDPQTETMRQALDKVSYQKTQEDVMFKQLVSFNTICKDGSIVKMLNAAIKNNGKLREDADYAGEAPIDATIPVETTDEEDTNIESPFDNSAAPRADELFDDGEQPAEIPAQEPVPDADATDVAPAPVEVEPEVPVSNVPQQAELPVAEPEPEVSEPVSEPPVEPAPAVNPDVQTDPDITPSDTPISEEEPDTVHPDGSPCQIANPSDTGGNAPAPQPSDAGAPEEPSAAEMEVPQDESAVSGAISVARDVAKDLYSKSPKELAKLYDKNKTAAKAVTIIGSIITVVATTAAARYLIFKVIIPGLRNLVYTFMYTSFKISDYWQIQAEFLEANADELEASSDMDEKKKEKIIKKQRKWAETFRKWSNLFNLDKKKTEQQTKKADEEAKKNKKKVGQNDDGDDVLF